MIERIGKESALAREALRAAQRVVAERATPTRAPELGPSASTGTPGVSGTSGTDFTRALADGLEAVDQQARAAESMPIDLLTGKVDDFHEIAVQLKSAELSFRFAMEIRNKLVDAYREVMRMSI
ncbi:MAG TPA: flagellar hook-basal body complex protein FliE [Planctomycetota bacterium]